MPKSLGVTSMAQSVMAVSSVSRVVKARTTCYVET